MKLVVLAAGKGTRLGNVTTTVPKCLVDLGDGTTFLTRIFGVAADFGKVRQIIVVAGYKVELVEQAAKAFASPVPVRVVYNPFFDAAGPLVSLWTAHAHLEAEDFFVCNGDTRYTKEMFAALADASKEEGIRLAIDRSRAPGPDDMKVKLKGGGRLARVGKYVPVDVADGISTGLFLARGKAARAGVIEVLLDMVRDPAGLDRRRAWHELLNACVDRGFDVDAVAIDNASWCEVDTLDELNRLQTDLKSRA